MGIFLKILFNQVIADEFFELFEPMYKLNGADLFMKNDLVGKIVVILQRCLEGFKRTELFYIFFS